MDLINEKRREYGQGYLNFIKSKLPRDIKGDIFLQPAFQILWPYDSSYK